ncbi:hypothetical protein GCM10011365_02620 [Marinicella pacifica]|uniref:Antitoxin ParD n=1 Tax=Marinicella pacifica TaxID=1171543 RepID=A0A917CEM0_9GAMM|nr:DUF1778 domain-containing protein [Marinicella pacifica]GGF85082.1 hypothetical protein GCM10011365_02620 [Marinicella pacifica]
MRLSIEITPEQHQLLKVAAALQGETIKDYVLKRTLPALSEQEALQKLEAFLRPRIESARKGELTSDSVDSIFNDVLKQG